MQSQQVKTLACPTCGSGNVTRSAHQEPRIAEIVLDGQKCPVWQDYVCERGHRFAVDVA